MNPRHLEATTNRENHRRGHHSVGKRRIGQEITHCPQGHEYTPGNIVGTVGNHRCRTCDYLTKPVLGDYAGPWGRDSSRRPLPGDEVVIPRGAWLTGEHKDLPKRCGVTYRVKVARFADGDKAVEWAGKSRRTFRTVDWAWPDQYERPLVRRGDSTELGLERL